MTKTIDSCTEWGLIEISDCLQTHMCLEQAGESEDGESCVTETIALTREAARELAKALLEFADSTA